MATMQRSSNEGLGYRRQRPNPAPWRLALLLSPLCCTASWLWLEVDIGDLGCLHRQKEQVGSLSIEFRVGGLDAEEVPIARRVREILHVEDRVVGLRQTVQDEDARHGREDGAEDRALERHRNERGP